MGAGLSGAKRAASAKVTPNSNPNHLTLTLTLTLNLTLTLTLTITLTLALTKVAHKLACLGLSETASLQVIGLLVYRTLTLTLTLTIILTLTPNKTKARGDKSATMANTMIVTMT